jgi:hypothetical protein
MSLTSFLSNNQDVRDHFRQQFNKPPLATDKDLLAPPLSNRYTLVGTAFDYLLRFYLKRLNPDAIERQWVAEYCLARPSPLLVGAIDIDIDTGTVVSYTETKLTKRAKRIIEQAKANYFAYLRSGRITDDLFKSALCLAQLDPIYRAGFIDKNMGNVRDEDIEDLRKLLSIVDPKLFKAQHLCMLNPTFGEASRLVGGADADLLIDDLLIDIKTTKKLDFKTTFFHQLMGYVVLHEIARVGDLTPKPPVTKAGIYFARHAHLHVFQLDAVIDRDSFPKFVRWFKKRAANEYPPPKMKPLH